MRILAINSSARKNGNTHQMLKTILEAVGENADKEIISLKDHKINPCDACYSCEKIGKCHIKDDMEKILKKMLSSDVILIGSPVYYGSVTSEVRMLNDRVGFMSQGRLKGKIGVPVTVARRWGHVSALAQIAIWFLDMGMLVVGPGGGWCSATAGEKAVNFNEDMEGVEMAKKMGKTICDLLYKFK